MSSIHIQNLSFKYKLGERAKGSGLFRGAYKTRTALKNISLEFSNGDVVGLIGQNGGGKSTLLKLLSGALQPSSGSIEIVGDSLSLLDRNTGTMREATLYQNAKLKSASLGLKGKNAEKFVNSCLNDSALENRVNDPLKTLSTGMSGRFNLALNTQIIKPVTILDEWISTLDTQTVTREGMLERLVREADIVVLASHNKSLIQRICNKVVLLDEGKVEYAGSDIGHAYNLLDRPVSSNAPQISIGRKQPLHFLRIPGTANYLVKVLFSTYESEQYDIHFHPFKRTIRELPVGEKVCFFYRDPVERFARCFVMRKKNGAPLYTRDWNEYEQHIFSNYETPNELALALSSTDKAEMIDAFRALSRIDNVNQHLTDWLIDIEYIKERSKDILFAGDAGKLWRALPEFHERTGLSLDASSFPTEVMAYLDKDFKMGMSSLAVENVGCWYEGDTKIVNWLNRGNVNL